MRLPIAIQSWNGKSKEFTIERMVNLYVEGGTTTAKSPAVLLNRPMLSNWVVAGGRPDQGHD